jgi:arginine/lysine/ornithine decarboxylase
MRYLDETLIGYSQTNAYPLHMPGHKRQPSGLPDLFSMDITEIDGFDNLHDAKGLIREAQERSAALFGADRSYFLVNGSTCGILAAISACTAQKGKILIGRNCHKSVYHACYLKELIVGYLYPEICSLGCPAQVTPKEVERALEEMPDAQAVVITSPTYEGIVSDIRGILDVTRRYQIPLIVDEAHGAHLGFHPYFPPSARDAGADFIIESLHKTMPCLTQTAIAHCNVDGKLRERFERYLRIYQTSSPSYVMMAVIDRMNRMLLEDGKAYFEAYVRRLEKFKHQTKGLQALSVFSLESESLENNPSENCSFKDYPKKDASKLVISTACTKINGTMLAEVLRSKYALEVEMAAEDYVIAMTSIMDTKEGLERFADALLEIDRSLEYNENNQDDTMQAAPYAQMQKKCELAEALEAKREWCPLEQAAGRIAADFICLYPPGMPVAVPGEMLTQSICQKLLADIQQGLRTDGIVWKDGCPGVCTVV